MNSILSFVFTNAILMIIHVNSTSTDNSEPLAKSACSDQELIQKFKDFFENESNDECTINWLGDNKVEVHGASSMSLHNFTLQAAAMGKRVKYHKKTIIEIV